MKGDKPTLTPIQEVEKNTCRDARAALVGRRIVEVFYMTREEAGDDWQHRPIVIALDNETFLFAACDEEGNDAGAMVLLRPPHEDLTLGRLP